MNYQAIIFDFDGTLADTEQGIIKTMQCLQKELGMTPMTAEELRPYIGPPLHQFFPAMFSVEGEELENVIQLYRRLFEEHAMSKLQPFPGVIALLSDIQKNGCLICIATCKMQHTCEEQAHVLGLDPYIDYICGADYVSNRLEKADILRELIRIAGIDVNAAVMIGDRRYDIEGAKAMGLPSIGVSYGCGTVEELQAHGAGAIVHSVEELRSILRV